MRKTVLTAALALAVGMACEPLEQRAPVNSDGADERVSVCVRVAGHTKSSLNLSETAVNSLNVYAYRDGLLAWESYAAEDEVELILVKNASYRLYALANCGEVHAPASETELGNVSVAPSQMVMCFREGLTFSAGAASSSIELPLTRLLARYTLVLDKSLENCDYQITSMAVRQQAAAVRPFASASAAVSTADGDSATAADLSALNSGSPAVFYIPENCQGVLLPGNTDPWLKVPSSLPAAKRNLCTYLHVEGTWTTSGASADLSLNLMLGADNCTDFNVTRNTSVTITLSLSDSGTLRSSWKTDMDNFDDERVLAFPNATHTVMQEDGWTLIPLTVSPPDIPYYAALSESEDPVMEAKVEGGKVYVRGLYDGDQRPTSTLTVTSWDGRISDSIDLVLDFTYTPLEDFYYRMPRYYGEYGYMDFAGATASNPVTVEAEEWSTVIGTPRTGSPDTEYYCDPLTGLEYYVLHSARKMFIHVTEKGHSKNFRMTQYKSRTELSIASTANPQLVIEDTFVTESGNRFLSATQGILYDNETYVSLGGEDGAQLDLGWFKIPEELLACKGKSATETDRFSEFFELYGAPTVVGGDKYGHLAESLTEGDCSDLDFHDHLTSILVYGNSDYGGSRPEYTISASLPLASGDVINGTGTITGIQAFPDQRYLGEYYNYQIAPGDMRSRQIELDFTSGGTHPEPSKLGVTWTVVHANGNYYNSPLMAIGGGSSDKYSSGITMMGHIMRLTNMSSTVFPACGVIGLSGTVKNPHTGKTYRGSYTLSLILYVSVGCQYDLVSGNKAEVSFVPFCEYAVPANLSNWSSYFPSEISLRDGLFGAVHRLWNSGNTAEDSITLSGIPSGSDVEDVCRIMSGRLPNLEFSFTHGGNDYTELLLDRSATEFNTEGGFDTTGSHGYYYLVRQYDVDNIYGGANYYGLENYFVEAAYGI